MGCDDGLDSSTNSPSARTPSSARAVTPGPVNDMIRSTSERSGANIMGKRMFDQGEVAWPEEAPFHTPVYVLTNREARTLGASRWDDLLLRQRRPGACHRAGSRSAGARDIRIPAART